MSAKTLLLAIVVLWAHQASVESRSKFVLGIRNGTLFVQQSGDPNKPFITEYPNESEIESEDISSSSSSSEIRNDIMQNDDPSNLTSSGWSDVDKLLDTDISSASNRERNRENFDLKNRTGNVTSKPLDAILSEDDYDNTLEDSQTIMDNIMAENNPAPPDSSDDVYDDTEERQQMLIQSAKAKDELTSAVRIDCMRVFAKRSKTDIDIMRPNSDCQKIDLKGGSQLVEDTSGEKAKKEEPKTDETAKKEDLHSTETDKVEKLNLKETPKKDLRKNSTAEEVSNIMLNATKSNAKNNEHELSIIEVSMMPDDYMASNTGSHKAALFKKEKSGDKKVSSDAENSANDQTSQKSKVEDKEKSNKTEILPDASKSNETNVNATNEMPLSPQNLTTNQKADSSIIEVQMIPGEALNAEQGSKKHILEKLNNKTDLNLSKNASSLNSTTERSNLTATDLSVNKNTSSLNSTEAVNMTKTDESMKKHNVNETASNNSTSQNTTSSALDKKEHIDSNATKAENTTSSEPGKKEHIDSNATKAENTTSNQLDKKEHIDSNATKAENTTSTEPDKKEHVNSNGTKLEKTTKEVKKEKKTTDTKATKRNKVQHHEKSKKSSTPSKKHKHHKTSLKRSKHKTSHPASKRRLVSNHVPFHRENNQTNFKNLNEEDKENKKNGGPKKVVKQQQPVTVTQTKPEVTNTPKALNKTEQKKADDAKNINITDAFSKRPTIAPHGINKNKAQVLQVDTDNDTPGNSDSSQDTASEYVKDDKYPNLGILPKHAGIEGQKHSEEKENLDKKNTEDATARKNVVNETVINYNGTINTSSSDAPPNVILKRILCFGDSLTKGMYAKGEIYHPYTIKLRELFGQNHRVNYNIINHGMNGRCVSRTMKTRLADDLHDLPKLDLVIILGGTNDLLHEDCSKKVDLFQEIKDMHKLVQDKGYRSVVVTIPESHIRENGTDKMTASEYNDAIEDVNQKLRMYAATEKLPLCDLADEFPRHTLPGKTNMASLWDDNVHPTAKGYDRIGEIMYDDVKSWV